MVTIATIHNDFTGKFGIPRQSGLVPGARSVIVFEKPFRNRDALRGLEGYSHLWLIWLFHGNPERAWEPTVRPPKLGGNRRMGVFATRSPCRPNPVGLSCVELLEIRETKDQGTVLVVGGADLMDGTPILDIKPYLPYTDSHPEARGGFTEDLQLKKLKVECPPDILERVPEEKREALLACLEEDPRPGYKPDGTRVYGFAYGGQEVRFMVQEGVLTVLEIEGGGET